MEIRTRAALAHLRAAIRAAAAAYPDAWWENRLAPLPDDLLLLELAKPFEEEE